MTVKINFLILLLLISSFVGHSQQKYATENKKAIKYYEDAMSALRLRNMKAVEINLSKAIEKDHAFINAYLLRAELWRLTEKPNKQIDDLRKAIEIDPSFFPYAYFNLATVEMEHGFYTSAINNFELFLKLNNVREQSKDKARYGIEKCKYAQTLVDKPVPFQPISLGDSINTNYDQYWPSLAIDGSHLYYSVLLVDSSKRTVTGLYAHQEDFYMSKRNGDFWHKGLALGPPLNTRGNEGALKISSDGNTIAFTACNREDGHGLCDIYFAYRTTTGWTNAVNLRTPINTKYSEKQPCLSADGNTLYFSSNRPGGIGGMDIWFSNRDKQGYWGKPLNMGSTINTKGNEESPFIHSDNKTFYYSSDGLMGLGMKDIFITRKNDSTGWDKPENIGFPINTFKDEIGLFVDHTGETAYYSTNFGDSSRNLYQFTIPDGLKPEPVSYLRGKVTDKETGEHLEANIELLEAITGKVEMNITSNKDDGSFLICLPGGNKYALNTSCKNYLFNSIHFNLTNLHPYDDPFVQNIELIPIKLNKIIVLNNIFFEHDSYRLLPESNAELIKIETFIKNNPNLVFEIGGHTDQSGDEEYNMTLSEKRAKAVYDYLISKNIIPVNLSYKGYGENMPINESSRVNAENRRTELKVVKKLE